MNDDIIDLHLTYDPETQRVHATMLSQDGRRYELDGPIPNAGRKFAEVPTVVETIDNDVWQRSAGNLFSRTELTSSRLAMTAQFSVDMLGADARMTMTRPACAPADLPPLPAEPYPTATTTEATR